MLVGAAGCVTLSEANNEANNPVIVHARIDEPRMQRTKRERETPAINQDGREPDLVSGISASRYNSGLEGETPAKKTKVDYAQGAGIITPTFESGTSRTMSSDADQRPCRKRRCSVTGIC